MQNFREATCIFHKKVKMLLFFHTNFVPQKSIRDFKKDGKI